MSNEPKCTFARCIRVANPEAFPFPLEDFVTGESRPKSVMSDRLGQLQFCPH